ncbi:MAG: TolB family protein, partial [Ignavibacteria bacterium]
MKTGVYKMITDGKSRNSGPAWSNKGDRYTFSSTKRNGTDTDIYLMKTYHSAEAEPLITEGGQWGNFDWSPDDSKLLVRKFISANESYIYIYDLIGKRLEQINPIEEKV